MNLKNFKIALLKTNHEFRIIPGANIGWMANDVELDIEYSVAIEFSWIFFACMIVYVKRSY